MAFQDMWAAAILGGKIQCYWICRIIDMELIECIAYDYGRLQTTGFECSCLKSGLFQAEGLRINRGSIGSTVEWGKDDIKDT